MGWHEKCTLFTVNYASKKTLFFLLVNALDLGSCIIKAPGLVGAFIFEGDRRVLRRLGVATPLSTPGGWPLRTARGPSLRSCF